MQNKSHLLVSGAATLAGLLILCAACSRETPIRGAAIPELKRDKTSTQNSLPMNYHALVIGISDYDRQSGEGWESLQTARNDAASVADSLEQRYGFEVTRLFDGDATRDAILVAMDSLASLTPNDAVLVYFAGHGYYDENLGEGYWIPADARKKHSGRYTKEDWIWNTMITKIIGSSAARHILVIADSCYGGSMFRGGEDRSKGKNLTWYQRALNKPSRYLITSGDIEPVLDSGNRHSIFAQELLNYLNFHEARIFAASDLALSLRDKVSALTGQMVRMGPLAVTSHSGGEFIFVSKGTRLPPLPSSDVLIASDVRGSDAAGTIPISVDDDRAEPSAPTAVPARLMQDAILLTQQGATNSAHQLMGHLLSAQDVTPLAQAVSTYLNTQQRAHRRDELRQLITQISERKNSAANPPSAEHSTQQRILACLGPLSLSGAPESEAQAILIRIGLRSELEKNSQLQIVEREALEDVLQELNLGSSSLSDAKAQLTVGKVLPASLLLLGNLIDSPQGPHLYLRLVDTETTRIIASFSTPLDAQDPFRQYAELARQIVEKSTGAKAP